MSYWFARVFSVDGWLPLAYYRQWDHEALVLLVMSRLLIGVAFYSMSLALLYFVRHRISREYTRIVAFLAIFIAIGGTASLASAWTVWHPAHWFEAGINAVIAVAAIVTSVFLWRQLPKLIKLPGSAKLASVIQQLEHQIDERKKVEEALRQSQDTLRELAAYQERIREDERKRIAREIHDELGQNLLALRLDVASLHTRTAGRHPLLKQRAAEALEHIDITMKSIRSIMNNLRPAVLDLGLQAAIEWQVGEFERRNSIPCELAMHEDGPPIPEPHATAVFRILQESLNNIGRHARATYVRIELHSDNKRLLLTIRDNGIGMYPGDRRKVRRFGLIGIEERVTILGGKIEIDTAPGKGTILRMAIPLHSNVPAAA